MFYSANTIGHCKELNEALSAKSKFWMHGTNSVKPISALELGNLPLKHRNNR